MSKRKKKIVCDKCFRDDFKSQAGLTQHKTKAHPYVPPPYIPPEQEHVNFIDLVRNTQWGKNYNKHGKKNPSDNDIIMGLLALIVEELQKTRREISKPKTLQ